MSLSSFTASASEPADSLTGPARPSEAGKAADAPPRWWQRAGNRSSDETCVDFGRPSEAALVESLLELAHDSLERCGLRAGDFGLQLIRQGSGFDRALLLVEVRNPRHMPWDLAPHMEQYLVGRIRRRSGMSVGRIVFTPVRMEGLDQEAMREGVRSAWTRLRASQRAQAPGLAGRDIDLNIANLAAD